MERKITQVLYQLKKTHPVTLLIHQVATRPETDYTTGKVTRIFNTTKIKRGIGLPRNELRRFVYDLSYIASAKNFTYGGLFDQADKLVIVDRKDLAKDLVITINNEATIEGERFSIHDLRELPLKTGYILALRRATDAGGRYNESS